MSNSADIKLAGNKVHIAETTNYPWDGKIDMQVDPAATGKFTIRVRIPGWAQQKPVPGDLYTTADAKLPVVLTINGKAYAYTMEKGYAVLNRTWQKGDKISLELPMRPQHVFAHEKVSADTGRFAIQYGPVVYCLEGVDNKDSAVQNIVIDKAAPLQVNYNPGLLNGINTITTQGEATKRQLNSKALLTSKQQVTAIPYYAWNNRGGDEMEVWIAYQFSTARPQPAPTIASLSKVSASIKTKSVKALNDQFDPANSNDHSYPFLHWWPKKDTTEWVRYDFDAPHTVSSSKVYWFDDGPDGGCRIPAAWKIYYMKNGEWVPVKNTSAYEIAKDKYNTISFEPVTTTALKLEVQLPVDNSAGIHEWEVE